MRPDTVLVPTGCDLKRLPLDASEVFLLSRLDGHLTLEEIGEIAGLGFDKARRLAERLVILGVVKAKGGDEEPAPKRRVDPRAEAASVRPPRVERRIDPRIEKTDTLPPSSRRSLRPAEPKKRRSTKSLKAQRAPAPPPPAPPPPPAAALPPATTPKRAPSSPRLSPMPRKTSKRLRRSQTMASVEAKPAAAEKPAAETEREKFQRLQAAAKLMAAQTRAEALVKAAEEALKAGDIIGAANNYRLALQMHEDPVIKDKLAAIDAHSRDLRHEKYVTKARAAERAERWEEAADHYVRANEARKDAAVAERAANALRLARGDLRQATALAEQAVAENKRNAEYRVTLGEVLLAAKLLVRAKEEAEEALALAPNHPRAKALAASLKKI